MIKFSLGGLRVSFGSSKTTRSHSRSVRGRYDAAQSNRMDPVAWRNVDSLSADEANNPQVRQIVRDRVRYAQGSNSYFDGMVSKYSEAVIGTGPRLEFLHESQDVNDQVELAFMDWMKGIKAPSKLLTMFAGTVADGESFMKETHSVNERSPVELDYELVEAELCTSEQFSNTANNIDGVLLGDDGKPVAYEFLKEHPGGQTTATSLGQNTITLRADQVIHFFRRKRAGQHRGISELVSSLNVGENLRDFTLSTLDAARIASKYAGVLHTSSETTFDDDDSELDGGSGDGYEALDSVTIEGGSFLTLPKDYNITQVKAEHPTTTYKDFKGELIAEQAQSINMPVNVAKGDSSGFNFASGKLDSLSWDMNINIRQTHVEDEVLWRMFTKWFAEARLIDGLLPLEVTGPGFTPRFRWFFDGRGAIDPSKQASADEKNLKSKSSNHAIIFGRQGKDWKKEFDQMAKEQQYAKSIGLELTEVQPQPTQEQAQASMREMVEEVFEEMSQ